MAEGCDPPVFFNITTRDYRYNVVADLCSALFRFVSCQIKMLMRLFIYTFNEVYAIALRILDVIIDDRVWDRQTVVCFPICIMQAEIANMLFAVRLLCLG